MKAYSLVSDEFLSQQRLLVIAPHADDESFGCAGTMARIKKLGGEVFVRGPDLRTDGVHGILVTKVLDVSARPVMLYDLDEKQEPLGALYLGGNADLYVLYDPCAETVRLVPVGSSRVEVIDQVNCRSP